MSRSALFVSPIQPIGGCSSDVYSWDKSSRLGWATYEERFKLPVEAG
jgi:hypothetical protein